MNRKSIVTIIGLLIISNVAFAQNFKNYDTNRNVKSITLKKATSDALKDCYILQLEETVAEDMANAEANSSANSSANTSAKMKPIKHSILITSDQLNDIKRAVLYEADYFVSKVPAATFSESQLLGLNTLQTIESALANHKAFIKSRKSISIADSCLSADCPQQGEHHVAESFQLSLEKKNYYFIMGENIERNGTTAQWDIIHLNTTRSGNETIVKVKKSALAEFFSRPQTMVP